MEGLLTFILIVVLVFYLLRIVGRSLLRYWIGNKLRDFESRSRTSGSPGREGEVKVEKTNPSEKPINRSIGEYVDYEEVTIPGEREQRSSGS